MTLAPLGVAMAQPTPTSCDSLTTTEAAGLLLWHLIHGRRLTNMEAAAMIGYEENGAYRLLCRLSRVVPIVIWHVVW